MIRSTNLMLRFAAAGALGLAALSMVAPISAAPPAPSGANLFRQRCQSCHSVTSGAPSTLGPNLSGVVGRKAAATSFRYSPALAKANITWTRENLDRFLSAPGRMVPGTRMVVSITDPAQRAEIVRFLESAH